MKMEERLANMSLNHKAKLANRLLRKVYTGTQDLSDITLEQVCNEWDKHPESRCVINLVLKGYGFIDMRSITDWLPGIGLWLNPIKMEADIDNTMKYSVLTECNKKEVLQ